MIGLLERGADAFLRDDPHTPLAAGLPPHRDEIHPKRREQLRQPPPDRAETEHHHRLPREQPGIVAAFRILPTVVAELILVRGQQLAPQREHHGEHVLRAGIGKHLRDIGKNRTARAKRLLKFRRVVPRVARRRDFHPAQLRQRETLGRVRLTKRDVRADERRISLPRDEHGRRRIRGINQRVCAGALGEKPRLGVGKLSVAPDREAHGFSWLVKCSDAQNAGKGRPSQNKNPSTTRADTLLARKIHT